jgi:signal transduction histidine kinase
MRKSIKHWWLHILFSLCAGSGLAQSKISLEPAQQLIALQQRLQLAKYDTSRIQLFIQGALLYQQVGKPKSGLIYLQQGLQLSQRLKQPLYVGRIYYQLGLYYDHQLQYAQSVDAYQKGISFLQKANQVPDAAKARYKLAQLYTSHGQNVKAVEQINKNLDYANQTGFSEWVGGAFSLLYEIHTQLDDEASAYADLQAMLKTAKRYHNPVDLWLAHANLAEWYDKHHQFANAQLYWRKAVRIALTLNNIPQMSETYCGLASNLIDQHRLPEAELILDKAHQEIQKDKRLSVEHVQRVLARLREQQNRLPEAYELSVKVLAYTRKNYPGTVIDILGTLFHVQKKQGNYQQALATFQEITSLNDSLREVKKVRAISMIESRLALEKQQIDIALLKKNAAIYALERERLRQQRLIYELTTAGFILILFLLGWFGWHTRQNLDKLEGQQTEIKSQSERLQTLNALKDKLFLLIGHDFRSPLMHLRSSLAQLDMAQRTTDQFTQQIDRLKRTADSLYNTMDNLLHWAALQREGMFTQPEQVELHFLVAETIDLLEPAILQKKLLVEIAPGEAIAWADEDQTQIVLRNIIHNAIKFTPPGGQIGVHFHQSDTESQLVITDTGVGMPTTDPQKATNISNRVGTLGETGTGLGLQVCDEFMKRNGGYLEINSELGKGTSVRLIFPVSESIVSASSFSSSTVR